MDAAARILEDWGHFYPVEKFAPQESEYPGVPPAVEVIVAGVKMRYPSSYTLVTDMDDNANITTNNGLLTSAGGNQKQASPSKYCYLRVYCPELYFVIINSGLRYKFNWDSITSAIPSGDQQQNPPVGPFDGLRGTHGFDAATGNISDGAARTRVAGMRTGRPASFRAVARRSMGLCGSYQEDALCVFKVSANSYNP